MVPRTGLAGAVVQRSLADWPVVLAALLLLSPRPRSSRPGSCTATPWRRAGSTGPRRRPTRGSRHRGGAVDRSRRPRGPRRLHRGRARSGDGRVGRRRRARDPIRARSPTRAPPRGRPATSSSWRASTGWRAGRPSSTAPGPRPAERRSRRSSRTWPPRALGLASAIGCLSSTALTPRRPPRSRSSGSGALIRPMPSTLGDPLETTGTVDRRDLHDPRPARRPGGRSRARSIGGRARRRVAGHPERSRRSASMAWTRFATARRRSRARLRGSGPANGEPARHDPAPGPARRRRAERARQRGAG